jgi:hypothetical protein
MIINVNGKDREMIVDEEQEYQEFISSLPPQVQVDTLSIKDLWSRLTDDEAVELDTALKNSIKVRQLLAVSDLIASNDTLWTRLRGILIPLFGPTRTEEILLPSFSFLEVTNAKSKVADTKLPNR